MKAFGVLLAVVAAATAASLSNSYIPPVADNSLPMKEYIPPDSDESPALLSDDGYRYKVVRKLKLRLRRDVNELASDEYLPPVKDEYLPPSEESQEDVLDADSVPEEKADLADDGYRYKTVRRLKYRHRRDVNELPAEEYLPPSEEIQEEEAAADSVPEEETELAHDGYRYKTVRRLKYRHRRDVNELPAEEYLPPSEEIQEDVAAADSVPEEKIELTDDGYRYKTVRRFKYRHRRDVNELPADQYLPPSEEIQDESVPEEKPDLAEDGYRYKTVRRLKYRHRRDVNELPAEEYLPPSEEIQEEEAAADSVPEEETELADDGYRYKTVRRLKYRHRRDVNELPAEEYLPPNEEIQEEEAAADSVPEEETELADDGYRYKTVRRLKYRHRRDVNELPAEEYLPPSEEIQEDAATADAVPEEETELADDGYRYKTVRRLKYRHRRDVNELPAEEYLPPSEEIQEEEAAADSVPEEETELAHDGYRYKTVRRLKYRHRRDVNELPAEEYLPPNEEIQEEEAAADSVPEEETELADDGYRYKTVRRFKYRHRRDVNELPADQYLPPSEEIQDESVPEEKTDLADDGYRYKTVRRLKYRHRRDVNELPAEEYLPPSAEIQEDASLVDSLPEEETELADDGYRYKTVRRLKYRNRRDVSELPAEQYLPPSEEIQEDASAVDSVPEEKTELADEGYRYKIARRVKYRRH